MMVSEYVAVRTRTLTLVKDLSQVQADYRPASRKWSIGEILHHLLQTDDFQYGEISRLIEMARAGKTPTVERTLSELDVSFLFIPKPVLRLAEVPLTLFGVFLPRPVRSFFTRFPVVPFQSPSRSTPIYGLSIGQLVKDLRHSCTRFVQLFEKNVDLDYSTMVHRHPLLGSNTPVQLIQIVAQHEDRHRTQIRRILADQGLPR